MCDFLVAMTANYDETDDMDGDIDEVKAALLTGVDRHHAAPNLRRRTNF